MSKTILKRKCECGYEITVMEKFEGLPCNDYCCCCCPYRKETPCPNYRKFGGIVENLKAWQSN